MGNFAVKVEATGGHGCQREIGNGAKVEQFCGNENCPDCITREYVEKLGTSGAQISAATLTRWPGQPSEVVDDLLTNVRAGSFR